MTTTLSVRFEAPAEDGIGRIVVDRPDDSVNALTPDLIEGLAQAVSAARAQAGLRGLIVASGKAEQWLAGADLKMVGAANDAGQIEAASRRFQAVVDELAWLPCTTVAAINGPALGGGLEVALACDYRVAIDARHVSIGQPEVNLGLLPAGGGTQRLPRLVGLPAGLDLILSGRRLSALRARRAGLLDEVVHPTVLDQAARAWARRAKRPLDRPLRFALSLPAALDLAEQIPAGRRFIYARARQRLLARTHGHYSAPEKALEAVATGFEAGLAAGLQAETRAFAELAASQTARNLIWLFMATQRQKRLVAGQSPAPACMAVVGAGFMGAAIAEVGAAAGLPVRVRDKEPEAVARGLAAIRHMVDDGIARRRFDRREGQHILQRVSGTTDYSGFSTADLVVEAVFEDLSVKRGVIGDLEAALPATVVIASNTSALPIREIARQAVHPERIVGMHFFSPAERMPLVEVIRPDSAADWAVASAVALGTRMGKTVIVVSDTPGFYTSRVLGVMLNEAAVLLGEGARIEDVDAAMTAFGFPVGPFVLYDEVGLQVALHAGETVTRAFGERVPPAPIVSRLVAAGQTGRKARAGFYVWRTPHRLLKRSSRVPNPVVYRMVGQSERRSIAAGVIQDRLALLFTNEAIRCLEEGVLHTPTDGDLGAVLGLGFPPFRGGPFHYADSLGLPALVETLRALAADHGSRYAPAGLLVERARAGRPFFEETQ